MAHCTAVAVLDANIVVILRVTDGGESKSVTVENPVRRLSGLGLPVPSLGGKKQPVVTRRSGLLENLGDDLGNGCGADDQPRVADQRRQVPGAGRDRVRHRELDRRRRLPGRRLAQSHPRDRRAEAAVGDAAPSKAFGFRYKAPALQTLNFLGEGKEEAYLDAVRVLAGDGN